MAGDWIKMRKNLSFDPDTVVIAEMLGCDQDSAVGKVFRFWAWLDEHTENGDGLSVTEKWIDVTLMSAPGFCAALRKVGWLAGTDGCLSIPNFERHNGKSAKSRALTKERMRNKRTRSCDDPSVTKSSLEKKRKEKKNPPKAPQGARAHDPEFEAWWKSYPVRDERTPRGNKAKARAEWDRLKPEDRRRVAEATRNLVLSGQLPKDAERFLRAPPGGGDPVWRTWLERNSGAPRASQGKPSAVARKEAQNHAEDYSWLTEQHPTG